MTTKISASSSKNPSLDMCTNASMDYHQIVCKISTAMTSLPPGCRNAENENYGGLLLTLQKFNCHLLQRKTENGYCPGGDVLGRKFWIQSSCACRAWSIVALRKKK